MTETGFRAGQVRRGLRGSLLPHVPEGLVQGASNDNDDNNDDNTNKRTDNDNDNNNMNSIIMSSSISIAIINVSMIYDVISYAIRMFDNNTNDNSMHIIYINGNYTIR